MTSMIHVPRSAVFLCIATFAAMVWHATSAHAVTSVVYISTDGSTSRVIVATIDQDGIQTCCSSKGSITRQGAPEFVAAQGRGLVQLAAPGAIMVSCAPDTARTGAAVCPVAATCRTAGMTNTFAVRFSLHYDNDGVLDSVTFDRAVTGLSGKMIAPGTPVPAAVAMRLAAIARRGTPLPVQDLTVLASKYSFTYKAPDASNGLSKTSVTAVAPTVFTNFNQITQFTVFAQPEEYAQNFRHEFARTALGTSEKGDKYTDLFFEPGNPKPVGSFAAMLKNNSVKFKYRFAPSNRDCLLMTTGAYEMIRSNMATNRTLKNIAYGYFEFTMNGEGHYATNVPALFKANKTTFSGKSIKLKVR